MLNDLTQEYLKEILEYDEIRGLFLNLVQRHSHCLIGSIAGTISQGYWKIQINGGRYLGHRLAFLYMTGKWPTDLITFADGNTENIAWKNLIEANHSEKTYGATFKKTKIAKGVYKNKNGFMSSIMVNKKTMYLGTFPTIDLAKEAYNNAARKYHKQFANYS